MVTDDDATGLRLPADLAYALSCEPTRVVHPAAWAGHIPFAFWLVRVLRPAVLVELGTHSGNSYFAFCQAMAELPVRGRAYAVDSWAGDEHAGTYGEEVFASVAGHNAGHFATFSTLLRTSFDEARAYFPDAPGHAPGDAGANPGASSGANLAAGGIDLLHIDGLHTYEAVRHDFETWKSALSSRAVVVFHDINVRERGFGVWRFWEEMRARYPSFSFHHSHGLGVLGVGAEQPEAMRALFAAEDGAAGALRACLAARGGAFGLQVDVLNLRDAVARAEAAVREGARASEHLVGQEAALRAALAGQEASHRDAAAGQEERHRAAIADRDAAGLNELAWRDSLLRASHELVAAKDAALIRAEGLAEARAHALDVRDGLLASRDALAAHLAVEVRDLRVQSTEERRLAGEERQARAEMQAGYEAAIGGLNRHREHLQSLVDGAMHEAALAQAQVARTREETELAVAGRYVRSTSWRLTRPLRVATRLLRGGGVYPAVPAVLPAQAPALPALPPPSPAAADAVAADAVTADAAADDNAATPDVSAPTPLKQAFRTLLATRLDSFLAGPGRLRLPRAERPDVSIVLVLFNQAELTFACLGSIVETLADAPFGVEVVIADNGSTDATPALLDRLDGATVIRNGANLHFLKAVNLAARQARGRTLLLLNNDAQLLPGSLAAALRTLDSDAEIGAVGGRIILPDGTLQEAGSIVWRDGACSGYARGRGPTDADVMFRRDVDFCSGAFLLTPAAAWRELGGFDERFAPAYYEETDYCVRLWESGRRVVFDPDVAIVHFEFGSATASGEALGQQAANRGIFVERHREWLAGRFPASPRNVVPASRARSDAPHVLVLEDRVPRVELGSGYPRANRMLHELVEAGAHVTFFPMTRFRQDWHEVRRALDPRIEVLIHAEAGQLREYLAARPNQFDAVLVCRPHNMSSFLEAVGPDRGLLGGASVLYDAEALFVTRDLQKLEADGRPAPDDVRHRMIATEVALTRTADAVYSVSEAERDTLELYGAREVRLLSYALDDAPLPTGFAERDQVVFLGTIGADDLPNADAVRWFAGAILPPLRQALDRPGLRLTVVGLNKAPTVAALDGDTVDLVGMVDELAPALARARVMVVPSRFGAGIPLKAQQAAVMGIPVVATSLIAGQLGWTDGEDLLVADDPAGFAAACARLYGDQALWNRIRGNALARVRREYAPEVFADGVRAMVEGIRIVHREPEPDPAATPRARQPRGGPKAPPDPVTSRPAAADWSVAVPFGYAPPPWEPKLAVVCHLFHPAVAPELLHYLRQLPVPADLLVSTDTEDKATELRGVLGGWDKGAFEVCVTPNRGRDIAPKLVGFGDAHGRYDLVLHLHSKVSSHAGFLRPWRSYLFETLMGSPEVVRSILEAFRVLPDLGMVAPQHFEAVRRWLGWNGNYEAAAGLARRMGFPLSPVRALDFPSGSMFWARPAALKPLLDLGLRFEDFPEEGAQLDHTPAHAIERLFFHACERSGHTWLKVAQPALMHGTAQIAAIVSPADLSRYAGEHGALLGGALPPATANEAAPMQTRVAPGLAARLAARPSFPVA